jgi:PRTRC genetic system ThiF family protein
VGRLCEDGYQISQPVDLVIGCVDTRQARREILRQCQDAANRWRRPVLWLDAGNDATTGQVVLGEVRPTGVAHTRSVSRGSPRLPARLPCVTDLFPALLDPAHDPLDPGPSCSRAEALSRQSLAVNRAAAFHALCLLCEAFTAGRLTTHGIFFDVAAGRATPLAIDRQAWAAFGYTPAD